MRGLPPGPGSPQPGTPFPTGVTPTGYTLPHGPRVGKRLEAGHASPRHHRTPRSPATPNRPARRPHPGVSPGTLHTGVRLTPPGPSRRGVVPACGPPALRYLHTNTSHGPIRPTSHGPIRPTSMDGRYAPAHRPRPTRPPHRPRADTARHQLLSSSPRHQPRPDLGAGRYEAAPSRALPHALGSSPPVLSRVGSSPLVAARPHRHAGGWLTPGPTHPLASPLTPVRVRAGSRPPARAPCARTPRRPRDGRVLPPSRASHGSSARSPG